MIKRVTAAILAGAGLCLLFNTPAIAQQQPMLATGAAPTAESIGSMHDGGYIGVTGGLNASSLKTSEMPSIADDGAFGGLYIGWGVVAGGLYYGLELDGMLRDVKPSITDGSTTVTMSNRWMASARARLGVPIGLALIYGTGGLAMQESVLKVDDQGINASDKAYVVGLVVGAGIEAALTNTVTLRLEGLHYAWSDEKFTLAGETATIGQADTVIRAGISFKLN
jgi:outer membrane immunogenic protein